MGERCVNIDTLKAVFYRLVHGGGISCNAARRGAESLKQLCCRSCHDRGKALGGGRAIAASRSCPRGAPSAARAPPAWGAAAGEAPRAAGPRGASNDPQSPPGPLNGPHRAARRGERQPRALPTAPNGPNGPAPRPPVPAAGCAASPARTSGPRPTGGRHRPPAAQPRPAGQALRGDGGAWRGRAEGRLPGPRLRRGTGRGGSGGGRACVAGWGSGCTQKWPAAGQGELASTVRGNTDAIPTKSCLNDHWRCQAFVKLKLAFLWAAPEAQACCHWWELMWVSYENWAVLIKNLKHSTVWAFTKVINLIPNKTMNCYIKKWTCFIYFRIKDLFKVVA